MMFDFILGGSIAALLAVYLVYALLRAEKQVARSSEAESMNYIQMTQVFAQEAFERIESEAKITLSTLESGDVLRTQLSILKKLTRHTPVNTTQLKRAIGARVIHGEKYQS